MHRRHLVALVATCGTWLFACSSGESPKPETGAGFRQEDDLAKGSLPPDAGSSRPPPPHDAGSSTQPTGPQCATLAKDACYTCCDLAFPQASDAFSSTFTHCACEKPGECAAQCGASYCAGKAADDGCQKCLDASATCGPATVTVCQSSPACAPYLGCLATCK